MQQVETRGGVFGPGGYGGGIFDGGEAGFGGLGRTETASVGFMGLGQDGAYQWCSRVTPCAVADPRVSDAQTLLNQKLRSHGYNPLTVDGKLGAATCGAMDWLATQNDLREDPIFGQIDILGTDRACQASTWPTKVGATKPVTIAQADAEGGGIDLTKLPPLTLPWGTYDPQTLSVQNDLNTVLASHDYVSIPTNGVLDGQTCGAMKLVTQQWGGFDYMETFADACQSFIMPHQKPGPGGPKPAPSTDTNVIPGITPGVKKSGMSTAWVVGGLLGAAALAGVYAMRKK